MDTPAKRETHQSFGPRKRLFTSNAPSLFTPHRNTDREKICTATGGVAKEEPCHEHDDADSRPLLTLPVMKTPSRRIVNGNHPRIDNALSEEVLKSLFEREFLLASILNLTDR